MIVLNTVGHPEVSDLFRVQAQVGQGEATSVWHVAYLHEHQLRRGWLVVGITDPVEVELVIEFNLDDATMWAVIDAAERSGTIWLINHAGWHSDQPVAGIRIATPPLPSERPGRTNPRPLRGRQPPEWETRVVCQVALGSPFSLMTLPAYPAYNPGLLYQALLKPNARTGSGL